MAPKSESLLVTQEIPLHAGWDVIVVGGGPAGCTAAAAAAREGAKTLLIEATGCLGGMGTNGLVPAWCPFSDHEKIIYRGLAEKVFTSLKAAMPHIDPQAMDWVAIDPERLKLIYDDLVTGSGASVLFHTTLGSVQTTAGRVTSIVVANKAGLSAYRAQVFVDATGDADLAVWAGAKYHKGDASGKSLMPATHCFSLGNVDEYAYRHGANLFCTNPESPIYKIIRSGRYPLISDYHSCNTLIAARTVGFNAGHLFDVDGTDPHALSQAMIQGRRMAMQFRDGLAEFHPAFANAFLATTGNLMGIRETRRIVGDYTLTLDDYIQRRSFPDEIARNCYYIDVHNKSSAAAQDPADFQRWTEKTARHYKPGESHGVPYRCLTPQGLSNVLVAGRSISCDQPVQGSVRVMPVCLAMGEAAGTAAAQTAAVADGDVHTADTAKLRARLQACGGWLPPVAAQA